MPNNTERAKTNEGFTMIKHNLYDWVIKAKLTGREQKIIHAIIRYTNGYDQREEATMSLRFFGDITGLGHRNADTIIKKLLKKKIIFRRPGNVMKCGKNVYIYKLNKAYCRSLNASQKDCHLIDAGTGVKCTPAVAVNSTPNKEINKTLNKDVQNCMEKLFNYNKNNLQ